MDGYRTRLRLSSRSGSAGGGQGSFLPSLNLCPPCRPCRLCPVAAAYDASERDDDGPATARRRTYVHDVLHHASFPAPSYPVLLLRRCRHVPRTNEYGPGTAGPAGLRWCHGVVSPAFLLLKPSLFIRLSRHARDASSLVHVLRSHAYMLFVYYG